MRASLLVLCLQSGPIAELVERLGDDDAAVRLRAAADLEVAREDAVPALLGALRSTDAEVRGRAAEILERRAARSDGSDLRLSLEARADEPAGRFRGTLRVSNAGPSAVLLHRPGLRVLGVMRHASVGVPFVNVGPGEAYEEAVEGATRVDGLGPRPFYVSPGGAVVGISPVRILRLKNADPAEVALLLLDLFAPQGSAAPPILIVSEPRTRSVVLSGEEALLGIAAEVVGKIDGDPTAPETRVLRFHQGSAEDLARSLERLLRPGSRR